MADRIHFTVDNIKGIQEAARLAPRRVAATLKREMQREGKKFQTRYRKAYLFGEPGINLPRRLRSFTKRGKVVRKKRTNRDAVKVQLAHVLVKVLTSRRGGVILAAYLSRFLEFHHERLAGPFFSMFRGILPALRARLEKEAARITQAVLDKGLRDAQRGGRR